MNKRNYKNQPYTFDNVKEIVEKEGYRLISKEYTGCFQKLQIECPKHGVFEKTLSKFNYGQRCPECSLKKSRVGIKTIYQRFYDRDLTPMFDEKFYKNSDQQLPYVCNKHPELGIQYTTNGTLSRKNVKFPCRACKSENHTKKTSTGLGSRSKLYKNNIIPDRRTNVNYSIWVNEIFKRDNYTCQCCNSYTKAGVKVKLNAHHILNYATNKSLRYDISNGITLCRNCHNKFHKIYGRINNTLEQLNTFIQKEKENK